jgi:hypothetical protein
VCTDGPRPSGQGGLTAGGGACAPEFGARGLLQAARPLARTSARASSSQPLAPPAPARLPHTMAAHITLADPPAPSSSPGSPDASDAEVDELDASGSEAGAAPRALEFEPSDGEDGGLAPGSFRAPSRRRIVRVPGHSVIPAERMEFILRADGACAAARRVHLLMMCVCAGHANHMSKEALHLISCATVRAARRRYLRLVVDGLAQEEFIKRLSESSGRTTSMTQRSYVSYKDICPCLPSSALACTLTLSQPSPLSNTRS